MNLFTKRFFIALSVLSPLFVWASEQPEYEIGDCMNISDFKTVARLHHALVLDNELAARCLNEETRTKEAAHTLAMQALPHESKQLKKYFICYSTKLHEDFLRESIDQELGHLEEQMSRKNQEALARKYSHLVSEGEPLLTAVMTTVLAEKCALDAEHEHQKKEARKTFEVQGQTTIMSINQKPPLKSSPHNFSRSGLVNPVSRDTCTATMITYHLPSTPQVYAPVHPNRQLQPVARRAFWPPSVTAWFNH